jgi:hypothetical protein
MINIAALPLLNTYLIVIIVYHGFLVKSQNEIKTCRVLMTAALWPGGALGWRLEAENV